MFYFILFTDPGRYDSSKGIVLTELRLIVIALLLCSLDVNTIFLSVSETSVATSTSEHPDCIDGKSAAIFTPSDTFYQTDVEHSFELVILSRTISRVATSQSMGRLFFQDQGKVREFCICSGKFEIPA